MQKFVSQHKQLTHVKIEMKLNKQDAKLFSKLEFSIEKYQQLQELYQKHIFYTKYIQFRYFVLFLFEISSKNSNFVETMQYQQFIQLSFLPTNRLSNFSTIEVKFIILAQYNDYTCIKLIAYFYKKFLYNNFQFKEIIFNIQHNYQEPMQNKHFKWTNNEITLKQKLRSTCAVPYYPHDRTPNASNNNYQSKYFLRETLTCKNGLSEKDIWKNKLAQTYHNAPTYSYNSTPKKNIRETVNSQSSEKAYIMDKNSRQILSYSQRKIQKITQNGQKTNNRFFQSKKIIQGSSNNNPRKQQDHSINKTNMTSIAEEVTKTQAKNTMNRVEDKFKHYLGILDNLHEKTKKNEEYEKLISIKKMYQQELQMLRSKKKIKAQQSQTFIPIKEKIEIVPKQCQSPNKEKKNKEAMLKTSIQAKNQLIFVENKSNLLQNKSSETRTTSNSSINSDNPEKNQSRTSLSQKHYVETHDQTKIQDFLIFGKKGKGRLGQVLLTIHKKTGGVFALKKIKKSQILENQLVQYLIKEIRVQATLNNPNIIKIYGVFDDKQNVYLILEYAEEGSLDQCMKKRNYHKSNIDLFTEKTLSFYLRDIMNAIQALHIKEIIHRDLKPGNVVITNNVCKLCDFGWATFNPQRQRRTTYCGTLDYAAPEIFKGDTYDLSVDLWQFGVMAYEMATGKLPFYMKSEQQTLEKVINYNDSLPFPWYTSELAKDFLMKLLQKNPEKRRSIGEMLQHKLITKYLADD